MRETADERYQAAQKEANRLKTEANKTNNNLANIMFTFQLLTANSQQETKEKAEREKQEKAAREEKQKKRDEQNEQKERVVAAKDEQYQHWLMQISDSVARMNQITVPQSIINTNALALSLSNVTTETNQLKEITPAKTRAPKRTMESHDSAVTEDTKTVPKYRKLYKDSSGVTEVTTRAESQSENYDLHNGEESEQNHDHQTESGQRIH